MIPLKDVPIAAVPSLIFPTAGMAFGELLIRRGLSP